MDGKAVEGLEAENNMEAETINKMRPLRGRNSHNSGKAKLHHSTLEQSARRKQMSRE